MARDHATAATLLLAVGWGALAAAGCENEVDRTPNLLPGASDVAEPDDAPAPGDVPADAPPDVEGSGSEPCACLVPGLWFRFDTLVVTSLDGGEHPVTETLSALWEKDIEKLELNILMRVEEVTATEVRLTAVNGARVEGSTTELCILPDTAVEVVHPRDGCKLGESDKSAMNVYAGSTAFPKNCATTLSPEHSIHVRNVVVRSEATPACDGIVNGEVVEGAIGEEELAATCTCLVYNDDPADVCEPLDPTFVKGEGEDAACHGCNANFQRLSTLVGAFQKLEYTCTTPDDRPAVCLTATYSAVAVDAPVECE